MYDFLFISKIVCDSVDKNDKGHMTKKESLTNLKHV